jgi:hypothetical protein
LALDYLLASEGGVCDKFNLSNYYLQIDDEGKVIKEITDKMKKLARVPVHTWKGWNPNNLFRGWFSTLGGFKTLIGTMFLVLGACLILPCLIPLILRTFRTIMEATIERKTAAHIIALWKYKPLIKMMFFHQNVGLSIKGGNMTGRQRGGREMISTTVKQKMNKSWGRLSGDQRRVTSP